MPYSNAGQSKQTPAVARRLARAFPALLALSGAGAGTAAAADGYFYCLSIVGAGAYYSDLFRGAESQAFAYAAEFASYLDGDGVPSTAYGGAVCYFQSSRSVAENELALRSRQDLTPLPVKRTGWQPYADDSPVGRPGGAGRAPSGSGFLCSFNPRAQEAERFFGGLFDRHGPCPSEGWGAYFTGDRKERLDRLIEARGLRPDRFIAAENPVNIQVSNNAMAFTCRDRNGTIKKAIVWDVAFMERLDRQAGSEWASVAVLGHEIAHHANSDTVQDNIPAPERREQELHADKWAGFALAQLGVDRDEAVAVFGLLGNGGNTHPPARQRVRWAGEGWDAGAAAGGGRRRPDPRHPPDRPTSDPPPQQQAAYCVTGFGVCPMSAPAAQGTPCYCPSAYGPVWGQVQ